VTELHVVRSEKLDGVLQEFSEILWTEFGETVVDSATDTQLKEVVALSSDDLLGIGFRAGVRVAMTQMLSGNVEVEFRHGKKAEVPKKNASQARAVRTPVRSLPGLALRWLRRRFWGR
jgi:hypothetical protein